MHWIAPVLKSPPGHALLDPDAKSKTHVETMARPRIICYGYLEERMVVVGYTPRGAERHVFSMRKANEREKARIAPLLEV